MYRIKDINQIPVYIIFWKEYYSWKEEIWYNNVLWKIYFLLFLYEKIGELVSNGWHFKLN